MISEYILLRSSLDILSLMLATKSGIIQRCHNIRNLGAASLDIRGRNRTEYSTIRFGSIRLSRTEPSRIKPKNILSESNRTESRMSKNRIESVSFTTESNLFLSQPNRIESNSKWTIRLEKLYIYTLLLRLPFAMISLCHFLSISVKKRSALCFFFVYCVSFLC